MSFNYHNTSFGWWRGSSPNFAIRRVHHSTKYATVVTVALFIMASCRPTVMSVPPTPVANAPAPAPTPLEPALLPPVPRVLGAALSIVVRYPGANQVIASRDSSFVLGSIGSGEADLSINGIRVAVAPNGAFIAWLPSPSASAPRYDLLATRGADSARLTFRVRYAMRLVIPLSGPLLADSASVAPAANMRALTTEFVRVSVRAASNVKAFVELADGTRRPMNTLAQLQASARLAITGVRNPIVPDSSVVSADNGLVFATDVVASQLTGALILAIRGRDTTRLRIPPVQLIAPLERTIGMLRSTNLVGSDTDRVVNARTIPDGTYKWLLFPGTALEVTGRQGGNTRVKLDDALDAWVSNDDIVAVPSGSAMPRRVTGGIRVSPSPFWVDVVIPMGERPAFLVEPNDRSMVLTLYGVQVNPEISPIQGNDTLVRRISWDQVGTNRARITFTLSQPAYGWLSLWDESRRAFVLRIRRVPKIDTRRPLAGLIIAVDPGHPPAGATGPTGLYEGDAVLPVGKIVAELLKAKGAVPVLTRDTRDALGLTERAVAARRANANAFVSIHLNALPDGVNPFTNNGTSTLFFHQASEPLARPVQSAMVAQFGLRDLGVHYQNLAVARPTWYPSVLTEGLFVIMPEQESAMRDAGFQRRYAEAIVEGLEKYFRQLATSLVKP